MSSPTNNNSILPLVALALTVSIISGSLLIYLALNKPEAELCPLEAAEYMMNREDLERLYQIQLEAASKLEIARANQAIAEARARGIEQEGMAMMWRSRFEELSRDIEEKEQ